MHLCLSTLVLCLVATTTLEAKECVCYLGQEPDQTDTKRYGFVKQTPCECTEFCPGGVNMKPQIKPYEVMVNGGSQIKQETVSPTTGHLVPVATQIPCSRSFTTEPRWTQVEEPLDLPMRLEFSINGSGDAWMEFSPGTKGYEHAKFSVGFFSSIIAIFKREDDKSWTKVKSKYDLNIFGETLVVTYKSGHIEVGVKDVETSHTTYDLPSPSQADRMFIILQNTVSTDWSFSEPCTPFTLDWLGKLETA